MALGYLIAGIVVLFIGIGIASFAWWAGSTTGSARYDDLGCGTYSQTGTETQCSAATGGMFIGIITGIVAFIFIVIGFIMSIIFGIKYAVDKSKNKLKV